MDVAEPSEAVYDYIVVGSGAGGGPLACNLAKAGFKVLVLEAGGDGGKDNLKYQVPGFHGDATEDPKMSWRFFVRHYTDQAQQERDSKFEKEENGIFYPRSGTLGGCTAHNAMIMVYPHDSDWDGIADLTGDPSWKANNMRKYFERLECCQYVDAALSTSRHGFKGWLKTNEAKPTLLLGDRELLEIVSAAGWTAFATRLDSLFAIWTETLHIGWELLKKGKNPLGALTHCFDPNDWEVQHRHPEGLAMIPLHISNGSRFATRDYLLATATEPSCSLTIQTDSLVSRVLFDTTGPEPKAIGVEYLQGERLYEAHVEPDRKEDPPVKTVRAKREVILAGGAFNTPQMLMLSGIGPKEELEALGIDVLVDSPGVGKNLQDRYEVGVIGDYKRPFSLLEGCTFAPPPKGEGDDKMLQQWMKDKTGIYATNGALISVRMRSEKQRPDPDLFIFALPAHLKGYFMHYSQKLEKHHNCITWAVLKAHTNNRGGEVRLTCKDPRKRPDINFHYFQEGTQGWEEDLRSVVNGIRFVKKITKRTNTLDDLVELRRERADKLERKLETDEEIATYVKDEAWGHHASCTCPIGTVLDRDFRVKGVANLRVVDASVFPRIPGFFIVSAVYMISEKASDAIIAAAK